MSRFLLVLCVVCSGCVLEDERADVNSWDTLEVRAGRIQVAPNPLIFPPTALGASSTLTFQVANTGDGTVRVESVEIVEGGEDGAGEIVAGQVWTPSFDIEKGGAPQVMTLEWRPVNAVADTAKLRFKVVNAANAASGVFEVPVSTPMLAPSLVAPSAVSFPEVPLGWGRHEVIYLQNDGSAELHISALVLEPQAEFTLRFPDPEAADVEAAAESEQHKAVLRPGERIPVKVYFTPSGVGPASAVIIVTSDAISGAEHRIALSGEGVPNQCPEAVAVGVVVGEPGEPASLVETEVSKQVRLSGVGSRDPDGVIDAYEWNILSRPNGSSARLVSSNRVAEPSLFLDKPGTYEVELIVMDRFGLVSCAAARVTIIAS